MASTVVLLAQILSLVNPFGRAAYLLDLHGIGPGALGVQERNEQRSGILHVLLREGLLRVVLSLSVGKADSLAHTAELAGAELAVTIEICVLHAVLLLNQSNIVEDYARSTWRGIETYSQSEASWLAPIQRVELSDQYQLPWLLQKTERWTIGPESRAETTYFDPKNEFEWFLFISKRAKVISVWKKCHFSQKNTVFQKAKSAPSQQRDGPIAVFLHFWRLLFNPLSHLFFHFIRSILYLNTTTLNPLRMYAPTLLRRLKPLSIPLS